MTGAASQPDWYRQALLTEPVSVFSLEQKNWDWSGLGSVDPAVGRNHCKSRDVGEMEGEIQHFIS